MTPHHPPTNTSEPSHDSPIAQAVDIYTKSTSYAGAAAASAKDQPKVNSNFRPLVADLVFDGVNISIPLFEEDSISLIATFIGKPIMLDSYTSSMCNDSWGRSRFARFLSDVNSEADLVDVVTISIPSLTGDGFTKETIRVGPLIVTTSAVVTPAIEKLNDGFQTMGKKKKRKGKSKTTNGGQFAGPSVKQTIRYEPKVTTSAPKKGTTNVGDESKSLSMLKNTSTSFKNDNISTSNSYSALNDDEKDEDEDVENVYYESANLFPNTKSSGSSSFMAAAGYLHLDDIWRKYTWLELILGIDGRDYNSTPNLPKKSHTVAGDGVAKHCDSVRMSKRRRLNIVKKLKEPSEEPESELYRHRKATIRQQQNESLDIAGRNLFDNEASPSTNSGPKPTPPITPRVLVSSMSDSEDSTVTYTEISSPYEDLSDVGSPGAEGPIFQDPPSPDYVPGPEEPEQAPPSPIYVPFVPEPVYPEFLPVDDEVFPAEEQPMPAADSPTHQSPGYIPESDPEEDPEEDDEEDPEEDPADYPADRGDDRDDEETV
ncbi:hypothetical protein Tco_0741450 [Tanacetum coccineum]